MANKGYTPKRVTAGQNYRGLLVRGTSYRVMENGYDFYLLSVGGKPTYVPKWITEISPDDIPRDDDNSYERD